MNDDPPPHGMNAADPGGTMMMRRRAAWTMGCLLVLTASAAGQEGTALRNSRGISIPRKNGEPRFREDTGWTSPDFNQPTWGVAYDQEFSPDPWTVVFQGDRANTSFTASTNKLTLDLNGHQYNVAEYAKEIGGKKTYVGGLFTVYDGTDNGSFLRVTNGALGGNISRNGGMRIGSQGHAGKLIIDHATVDARIIHVGAAANSSGEIVLGDQGRILGDRSSGVYVGKEADGAIILHGAGSRLVGNTIRIGDLATGSTGTIVVNHAEAVVHSMEGFLDIANVAPTNMYENLGMRIQAGRVRVDDRLALGLTNSNSYGAVLIDGGTLDVGNDIIFRGANSSSTRVTGGKLFLHGGELAVTDRHFNPTATEQFYWKAGTVKYRDLVYLDTERILDLTTQGAETYRGDRRAGALATGQTLVTDTSLALPDDLELAGGTIRAAGPITTTGDISGYGTIDAVVEGSGALMSESGQVLRIGALNGENSLTGAGDFHVGHLNRDAVYGGTASGTGEFHKVGSGTQTVTGSLGNSGGVFVEEGGLAFEGSGAGFSTSDVSTAAGTRIDLLSGSSGMLSGTFANAGRVSVSAGSSLSAGGEIVNQGWLINNGLVSARVRGAGKVSGNGSFTGTVDILAGAVLAPGNSIGTATMENLTLGGGGKFEFEIASADGVAGIDWDLASVTDKLLLTASTGDPFVVALVSLNAAGLPGMLADFDAGRSDSWRFIAGQIVDPTVWTPGCFRVDTTGFANVEALSMGEFSVRGASDGLYLDYQLRSAAVPEPNAGLLLLALAIAWYGGRQAQAELFE